MAILKHLEFVKRKPLVLLRIISGFFRKIVLKQDVLRTIDLAITGNCHYKCEFCSAYRLYGKDKPFLTVEQIKEIWKQCVRLGVIHVNLTGGEPFLRDIDEICQIIRNFNPSWFLVSLVSNGLNLTEDKLKRLKEAGLDTLQLSLESLNAQKHDKMVGVSGSFDKVMDGIKYAKKLKLNICLNVVFCKDNIEEIRELVDFSKECGVFLVLNTISMEGKLHEEKDKRLECKDAEMFEEILRFSHVRHDSSVNFSGKRECPGGKERIHITAYGDVLTCPLVQLSYGNVLEEPLKRIHERMLNMEYIKKYSLRCKHAFDEDYYKKCLLPIESEQQRPVLIFKHPLFKS